MEKIHIHNSLRKQEAHNRNKLYTLYMSDDRFHIEYIKNQKVMPKRQLKNKIYKYVCKFMQKIMMMKFIKCYPTEKRGEQERTPDFNTFSSINKK